MPGLMVDMAEGDSISIGGAVVRFQGRRGRKVRLRVEAPQDLRVEILKPKKIEPT